MATDYSFFRRSIDDNERNRNGNSDTKNWTKITLKLPMPVFTY